jgi:protein pelota
MLQVTGNISEENHYVKLGAFHTLDLEMNRDVKIIKEMWDAIALQRVEGACVEGRGAEVGAIVCGEGERVSLQPGKY